jgi:hypothetical protein
MKTGTMIAIAAALGIGVLLVSSKGDGDSPDIPEEPPGPGPGPLPDVGESSITPGVSVTPKAGVDTRPAQPKNFWNE